MRLCFCPSERENKAQPQLAYVSQVSVLIHLKYEKNREDIGLFGI